MSRDAAQFDENFGAVPIRAQPVPSPSPLPVGEGQGAGPLSADDLGALLCRIPYTNLATGEQGEIVLSAADWQALLDRHSLIITRRPT